MIELELLCAIIDKLMQNINISKIKYFLLEETVNTILKNK